MSGGRGSPHTTPLCGPPKPHEFTCFGLRRTDVTPRKGPWAAEDAPQRFGPADLRSAYGLPADGGAGKTIAIVDAFDNPDAEADLAVHRAQYGLPACTTANACFAKVVQRGGTDYPAPDPGWATESNGPAHTARPWRTGIPLHCARVFWGGRPLTRCRAPALAQISEL